MHSNIDNKKSVHTLSATLTDIEKSLGVGKKMLSHEELVKIDKIRRSALKGEKGSKKAPDLMEKSRKIILEQLNKQIEDVDTNINQKGLDSRKANRDKMLLYHIKVRLQQNDKRSLAEIEEEFSQFAQKAGEEISKLVP